MVKIEGRLSGYCGWECVNLVETTHFDIKREKNKPICEKSIE